MKQIKSEQTAAVPDAPVATRPLSLSERRAFHKALTEANGDLRDALHSYISTVVMDSMDDEDLDTLIELAYGAVQRLVKPHLKDE